MYAIKSKYILSDDIYYNIPCGITYYLYIIFNFVS